MRSRRSGCHRTGAVLDLARTHARRPERQRSGAKGRQAEGTGDRRAAADLYPLLADVLDEGVAELDSRCVGVVQDDSGVTAHLADGREVRGDVLIGADGAQSTVRTLITEGIRERYAGYAAWQCVVDLDTDEVPPERPATSSGAAKVQLLPRGAGPALLVHVRQRSAAQHSSRGRWKATLQERFAGWPQPTEAVVAAAARRGLGG